MNSPASGSIADGANVITNKEETNVSETTTNTPFADGFAYIYEGPLGSPIPIPKGSKKLVRKGITGRSGVDLNFDQLQAVADNQGESNVGIRLADEIIGIDVDFYGNKTGKTTIDAAQESLGYLPQTIKSSRRGAGVSGIYFYRVPAGQQWRINLDETGFGQHIDVIQRGHRYAVTYPSVVDGLEYRWFEGAAPNKNSAEQPCEEYPVIASVNDIPPLPAAWVEMLRLDPIRVTNINDEILLLPEDWVYADVTAGYVSTMIDAWEHDTIRGDVHSWIFNQSSRMADAHRLGLVTEADLQRARAALVLRAERELGNRSSSEDPATEVRRCWDDALAIAMRHTEDQATLSVRNKKDGPVERFDQNTPQEAPEAPSEAMEEQEGPAGHFIRNNLLTRSQLKNVPGGEPLIGNGVLFRRTVALCAGYHGTGKSFVALDWAACVATGLTWQGCSVRQGRVLYIIGEGVTGIDDRLNAWETERGQVIPDENFVMLNGALQFENTHHMDELQWLLQTQTFELVVVDTMARSTVGLEENSAKDMGRVIKYIDDIKKWLDGGTVLLVHHTGKDKATVRGSSALEAAMDTVHVTSGHVKSGITLEHTKNKYGPDGTKRQMSLALIGASGVLRPQTAEQAEEAEMDMVAETAEAVFRLLAEHPEKMLSASKLYELADEVGIPLRSAQRALNKLKGDPAFPKTVRVKNISKTANRPIYTVVGDIEAGRV